MPGKTTDNLSQRAIGGRAGLLALLAVLLFSLSAGNVPLRDWDEATFAQVAREMATDGTWMRPTLFGEPYFNKPPLLVWLIGASFVAFGESEAAARLPAALLAAMAVPLLYLMGRWAFGRDRPALMAAVVYLTLLPVVRHGRLAMIDGMVNTFLLAALYGLLRGQTSVRWLVAVGMGLGLIALAKGALAAALAGAVFLAALWMRPWPATAGRWAAAGLAAGVASAVAWYTLQVAHHGLPYIAAHFGSQSLQRVVAVVDGHGRPWWYYLGELVKTSLPWLTFAVAGCRSAWPARAERWAQLILATGASFFILISTMPTKLPWYVMPCHIFVAIAAGATLDRLLSDPVPRARAHGVVLLACGAAAAGALWYQVSFGRTMPPIAAAVVAAATCAGAGLLALARRRAFVPALAVGLYVALVLMVRSPLWNWEVNEAFPVPPVAALVRAHVPAGSAASIRFPYERPSLNYYAGRRVSVAGPPGPSGPAARTGEARGAEYLLIDADQDPVPDGAIVLGRAGRFVLLAPPAIR